MLDRALAGLGIALIVVSGASASFAGGDTGSGSGPAKMPAAAAGDHVTIRDFKYGPVSLEVKAGTKVTWTNQDAAEHTATSDRAGAFDTGTLTKGKSKTLTLAKSGTYTYVCSFHAFMHGTIVVR